MTLLSERVVEEANKVEVNIKTWKTEIMKIRSTCNSESPIDNTVLKEVEKITYLGCEIRRDSNIRNEVGIRIGKAEYAFRTLNIV